MSHWAELDQDNKVIRVLVGDNNDADEGYQWLIDNLGGTWIKTSYNATIRKNYAGIGFTYDANLDAFINPRLNCHDEETFNSDTCIWECNNEAHNGN
jgi:hypothetical protein